MIRARLLVGFVLVALLPIIGVSIGTSIVSYRNDRQQSIDRLESVAARKELAIEVWVHSLQQELQVAARTDYSLNIISNALKLSNENTTFSWYNNLARKRLQYFVEQSAQFDELFLVDLQGKVVVSINPAREQKRSTDFIFNLPGFTTPYTQFPFYWDSIRAVDDPLTVSDYSSVFMLAPVTTGDGLLVGMIGGKVGVDALHTVLDERTGLGETGRAYLVNRDYAPLAGTDWQLDDVEGEPLTTVRTNGVEASVNQKSNVEGIYTNPFEKPVVGIYRWLPELNAVLVVEQDSAEAFQAVFSNTKINLVIAFLALVLAIFAALYMTQNIANPISDLAHTASRIAQGDLSSNVQIIHEDEIGALAKAFNSMTTQLRDLINSLEQRVQERTRDFQEANMALKQRAIQLETSAQVGREITSILDIDLLLNRVVELIQDAFGYYHVQIFLLAEDAQKLILGASSRNRYVQHPCLDIREKSVNIKAAQTGKVQLANDVSSNPNFLYDDQLPETQSELVIPLMVGKSLIGTLDVLASKKNAFTNEDTLVIQSLGDQIAIAIENARLYDKSKELAVLEERNRLARELHDSVTQSLYSLVLFTEGWRRMLSNNGIEKIEEYLSRIGEIAQQALKEMRLLILELRPPMLEQEGLVGALQKRLDAVEKRVGINGRVIMENFIELPATVEQELFRIAQEALNNSLKHANATKEIVRIFGENDQTIMEIVDDGKGFDTQAVEYQGGMGLFNMSERAKQLGGIMSIHSIVGKGTTVRVMIPNICTTPS